MGIPVRVGDTGGPYTFPSTPPAVASFPVVSGSVKTLIGGQPVAVFPGTVTAGGQVITSTLNSIKTLVEGAPVILGGSVTNLSTGWITGVMQASVPNVQVN